MNHDVTPPGELDALRAENARLRAALKPFSALLASHHARKPDAHEVFGIDGNNITAGDIRAARAALVEQGRREGLEAAAAICADAANEAQDDNGCGSEAAAWLMAAARSIRALSDDAVTAARAKIEADGYRRGLEAAAALCADAANEAQDDNECGWEAAAWLMAAARSIRALNGGADD